MPGPGDDAPRSTRVDSGETRLDPGKYQVFATLGRGGMADVFLAVSLGLGGFNKLVVLKRLRPHLADEKSFREMFLDEARLAARLNHPNVVQSYEVGEENGGYFIAMEYLDGQPLNRLIEDLGKRGERLDPGMAVRIISDACAGLAYAHDLCNYDGTPLRLIHRDVSPHNIFLTYDGQVKLCDFGIAKANVARTKTEVGVIKGKVAYMAPEQASGAPIDSRADLFAIGLILWELLAGRRLFHGGNAADAVNRLANDPIPRPSTIAPGIDPGIEAIVMRALEKGVAERYQTARELRTALEGWLRDHHYDMRTDNLGALLTSHFEVERAHVQDEIGKVMAAIGAGGAGKMPLTSLGQLARAHDSSRTQLVDLGTEASGATSGLNRQVPVSTIPAAAGARARSRPRALLIGGGVLLLGLAAFAGWRLPHAGRTDPQAIAVADAVAPSGALSATQAVMPTSLDGSAATQSEVEAARAHYERGSQLYQEGSFEPALAELEKANELAHTYKLLYNLALVQVGLDDFAGARTSLRGYLDEGREDVPAARRDEATHLLTDLEQRAAAVQITVNVPGADVTVDEKPIGSSPFAAALWVNPGPHRLVANKAGVASEQKEVAPTSGQHLEVSLEVPQTPAARHASSAETHATHVVSARPSSPPAPATTGAAPATEEAPGYLTLDTYPWTRVSENGRVLGTTPMVHVTLPPGEHMLTLENPDVGVHRTYRAVITSGATLTRQLVVK